MKYLTLILALALVACGTTGASDQDAGGAAGDQEANGGILNWYHGGEATETETEIKGEVDGVAVDVKIKTASPMMVVFGNVEAGVEQSPQGSTSGVTQGKTDTATPKTDVSPEVTGLPQ